MKEKIASNLKKEAGMDKYRDILLKKCKGHNRPVVSTKELKALVARYSDDLKKQKIFLREEIAFKKVMHPVDAKERPELYKMNFLSQEPLLENLTILIVDSAEAEQE